MAANRIEAELLIFGGGKSRDGNRRLRFQLRRGLRHGDVARMADLAMLFVRRVAMPVPCSLHGKQAHAKNQGHRQQS
jgi:hypothetical protein